MPRLVKDILKEEFDRVFTTTEPDNFLPGDFGAPSPMSGPAYKELEKLERYFWACTVCARSTPAPTHYHPVRQGDGKAGL